MRACTYACVRTGACAGRYLTALRFLPPHFLVQEHQAQCQVARMLLVKRQFTSDHRALS